ncbi:MAG TPA: hypothetical protein VKF41_06970 [Bryobacteraceae bacterium]|nr:hypothetical protein [Bryobacteraceae bacterium]
MSLTLPVQILTGTTSDPFELSRCTTTGLVAGAGIDVRAGWLHIQPEARFTRWNAGHFLAPGPFQLLSNLNQVEFLVAITF